MRLLAILCALVGATACSPRADQDPFTNGTIIRGGSPNAEAACLAAGGQCRVGPSDTCLAQNGFVGPQDCNPEHNPGGGYCCLPCPADGGDCG